MNKEAVAAKRKWDDNKGRRVPYAGSPADPAAPGKRMTLSAVLEHMLDRPAMSRAPSIGLERSAAPGSKGLVKITVEIPVGEEYPTVDAAHAKAVEVFEDLCARFPLPDGLAQATQ